MIHGAHKEKKGHNICDGFTANSEPSRGYQEILIPLYIHNASQYGYLKLYVNFSLSGFCTVFCFGVCREWSRQKIKMKQQRKRKSQKHRDDMRKEKIFLMLV